MPNAAHRRRVQALATGAIAVVAAAAQAMPAQADDTQHSKHNDKTLNNAHPSWATADKDRGAVPASQSITTRVFLTGQDSDGLAAFARAVNDPTSPDYGHFLTPDQVKQQFGATPAQIAAVQKWLQDAGLSVVSVNTNWIDAKGEPAAVQRAFGTQMKNYQRPDGSVGYAASSAAVVPAAVADYVTGVTGLAQATTAVHVNSTRVDPDTRTAGSGTGTTAPSTNGVTAAASNAPASGCGDFWGSQSVTGYPAGSNGANIPILPCQYGPAQLRQAYGLTAAGKTGKGATIAIVDWWASPTMAGDVAKWASGVGDGTPAFKAGQYSEVVNKAAWTHTTDGMCPSAADEEALDVEMAHGLAPDANIVYVGANSCTDQDLMAAEQKIVDQHLADVVSNSWGEILHSTNGDQDPAVVSQYDRIFQQGAAEGISFLFSSGDCGDDDPANKAGGAVNCNGNSSRRQAEWPASSQWVTAVGGTTLATKNAAGDYAWEVAMGDRKATANPGAANWTKVTGGVAVPGSIPFYFGGGGGTSEDEPQPWYQAGKVPTALATTEASGQTAARPMRVVPDVAMNGSVATAVQVGMTDDKGNWTRFGAGGTSVAAPEFAAVLANAREAAGHSLGFVNPALYSLNAGAFHDVTARPGVTEGMRTAGGASLGTLYQVGLDNSLTATPGYDTATGLGSPNAGFVAALAAQKAPAAPATAGPAVTRVWGSTRYETAIAVSKKAFPTDHSAPAVVLATGGTFPDALAGVPFAKQINAPLLLTPSTALDPGVANEIKRVLAPGGQVYVLGGEKAVTPAVLAALKLPAGQVHRIFGDTRYTTSVAIAQAMGSPTNVVLATGRDFPDALAAGPYASDIFTADGKPAAILLTDDTKLPPAAFSYMDNHVMNVAAIGVQASKSIAGFQNLVTFPGKDRYDTASRVAAAFTRPQIAGVATGTAFADALTGAALLARSDSPLLLTDPKGLSPYTAKALQGLSHALSNGGVVDIFGGPVAVTDAVMNQVAGAVGGHVVR
ncbi:hypothetical protein GCM10009839_11810 [Catenulispora yoronensis]|uniref:Peptidase S53 domain-containing protein n=1 Tax=Catenulispora yoronensis TaxID=450799 RepID=A0ABN2TR42_9ACTN